jgi:hypothetical protein
MAGTVAKGDSMTPADLLKTAKANGLTATVGPVARMPGVELVKRKPPAVATGARGRWAVILTLACRVVSEANRRDHWTVKRRRAEVQRFALAKALDRSPVVINAHQWHRALPFVVTWVHVGRVMDSDNLAISFKALRDEWARLLIVDDGDPRIDWRYDQRAGSPGVELRIESGDK